MGAALPGWARKDRVHRLQTGRANETIELMEVLPIMRRPRLRFTIRKLMIVVLVASLGSWSVKLWLLSRDYARRAKAHEAAERQYRAVRELFLAATRSYAQDAANSSALLASSEAPFLGSEELATKSRDLAASLLATAREPARKMAYYGALKRKYQRAARYPWLSVAPDPPAP
jgi:hypothetical protein